MKTKVEIIRKKKVKVKTMRPNIGRTQKLKMI